MNAIGDTLEELYKVILSRKASSEEGSYTGYLFREGLDKILKKCGEESAEVIIAAKTLQRADDGEAGEDRKALKNEVCDLIYHLMVLLADRDIPLSEIEEILGERSGKTGNLKKKHLTDKNS